MFAESQPVVSRGFAQVRHLRVLLVALAVTLAFASPALAQWPTACVALNDIVEAHLGNHGNVGIYQRTSSTRASPRLACQSDHRDDVRTVFAWAFDEGSAGPIAPTPWPSTCVALNDIVEAHLGNTGNVQICQRTFGPGPAAESACQRDHRQDVRGLFAWAFGGPQPATRWLAVDAGARHTCGIRANGTVACWGNNTDGFGTYYGQSVAPSGTFTAISAGDLHTCGVRTDGTVACWGADRSGQSQAPAGTFQSVSAGSSHSCGVRTDGTVACWGSNHVGQAAPPPGTFSAVSAGSLATCGLRTNGTLACWGYDESREPPPDGIFNFSQRCPVGSLRGTHGWSHGLLGNHDRRRCNPGRLSFREHRRIPRVWRPNGQRRLLPGLKLGRGIPAAGQVYSSPSARATTTPVDSGSAGRSSAGATTTAARRRLPVPSRP